MIITISDQNDMRHLYRPAYDSLQHQPCTDQLVSTCTHMYIYCESKYAYFR